MERGQQRTEFVGKGRKRPAQNQITPSTEEDMDYEIEQYMDDEIEVGKLKFSFILEEIHLSFNSEIGIGHQSFNTRLSVDYVFSKNSNKPFESSSAD